MLVAETADHYRFVTQTAHASVAGQLAERWGRGDFESPTPRAAVTAAAHNHDNGWWHYDRRPHLDDGEPVGFRDVPPETWVEFYETGIESVVDMDRYAGLLTSMHGAGLRRQRYGLSPSMPADQPAYESFVDSEERRQRRLIESMRETNDDRLSAEDAALLDTLHESGEAPPEPDSRLWRNYRLLQAWDQLSLAVCATLDAGEAAEIGAIPTRTGAAETLTVEALSDETFGVSTYPFETAPVSLCVPTRRVRTDAFETEPELFERYYSACVESVTVRIEM